MSLELMLCVGWNNVVRIDNYLISSNGQATATGLSAMVDNAVSHDQITRFLSKNEFTSKELWKRVKKTVREVESEDGCLIFDDTVQEKKWHPKGISSLCSRHR